MPTSHIIPNSSAPVPQSTNKRIETFTGDVYMNSIHSDSAAGMVVVHVTFLPGARTHWHTHERGQVLQVIQGSGWVCDKGETPRRIRVGDTVVCPPGTHHWHGADEGSLMTHTAIGLGKTEWLEGVTDEDYNKIKSV